MNVVFADTAKKKFLKLDKTVQLQIKNFIFKLQDLQDPRSTGKALKGSLSGLWRYRVGDYRLVCDIEDQKILITVLRVGHRKEIYK
jgi:mRNA interferase RelE/StbE